MRLMRSNFFQNFLIGLLLLLVIPLFLGPLFSAGKWPDSHEGVRYLILFDNFRELVLSGETYPRWLPNLNGGYGYPTFVFYQPLFFFLALPFSLFGAYPDHTLIITTYFIFWLGAMGIYKMASIECSMLIAVSVAILFLMTPVLYLDLFVRGDLSELLAVCVSPWCFYNLFKIFQHYENRSGKSQLRTYIIYLAITIALIILAHPITAMYVIGAISAILFYGGLEINGDRNHLYAAGTLAILLGLIFSAPYWYGFLISQDLVHLENATGNYFAAENHVVYPQQLVERKWGFGISVKGIADSMSFQLGLPHFLLAMAGAIIGRKSKIILGSFVVYILLILLMLPASEQIWAQVGILNKTQFPWRILSATAVLQCICITGIGRINFAKQSLQLVAIIAILYGVNQWQMPQYSKGQYEYVMQDQLKAVKELYPKRFITFAVTNEFLPRSAKQFEKLTPLNSTSKWFGQDLEIIGENQNGSTLSARIYVAKPGEVVLQQLYFPGWKIYLDDQRIPDATLKRRLLEDGRISIAVGVGTHDLKAYYDSPLSWVERVIILLLSVSGILAVYFKFRS